MAERDELDRLLDAGLASYSDCEPVAGIEERVMRRVVGSKRRPWLRWLAAAVPVAACLLVLLSNREMVQPLPPAPIVAQQRAPEPEVALAPTTVAPVRRAIKPRIARENQFPTPAPMTSEEHRLIELAAVAPEELLKQPAQAIEIVRIEIKPLGTSGTN